MMLSAVLMLGHIGEAEAADRAQRAIHRVYSEGKTLTRDAGGTAGTTEFAEAVVAAL
jgi:isocitrate dehydrogenase (NAD+)